MVGRTAVCLTALALGACKASAPAAHDSVGEATRHPRTESGSWYLARLVFKGVGDLPFFLHLPPQGQPGTALVVNGDETVEFKLEWREEELTLTGPWNYTS